MNDRQRAKAFWTDAQTLSELADRAQAGGDQLSAIVYTAARFSALGIHPDPVMPPPLPRAKPAHRPRPAKVAAAPAAPPRAVAEEAPMPVEHRVEPVAEKAPEPKAEPREMEPAIETAPAVQLETQPPTMPILAPDPLSEAIARRRESAAAKAAGQDDAAPAEAPIWPSSKKEKKVRVTEAEVQDAQPQPHDEPEGELVGAGAGSGGKPANTRQRISWLTLLALISAVMWMVYTGRFMPIEQALTGIDKYESLLPPDSTSGNLTPTTMESTPDETLDDTTMADADAAELTPTEVVADVAEFTEPTEDRSVFTQMLAEPVDDVPATDMPDGDWMNDKLFAEDKLELPAPATTPKQLTAQDQIIDAVRTATTRPEIRVKPLRQPIAEPAILEAIRSATQEEPAAPATKESSKTVAPARETSPTSAAEPAMDKASAAAPEAPMPEFAEGMADWVESLYDAVTVKPAAAQPAPAANNAGWLFLTGLPDVPAFHSFFEGGTPALTLGESIASAPQEPQP